MNISTAVRHPAHPSLFTEDLGAVLPMAACRNWCGDFYEEATVALCGGYRILTVSTADACPDVRFDSGAFAEVKSIGSNRETLVYEERLNKDQRCVEAGSIYWYYLWHHNFKVGSVDGLTLDALRKNLAAHTVSLTIVPFAVYQSTMLSTPLRDFSASTPNRTGRGFGSAQYRMGYRCRLNVFQKMAVPAGRRDFTVYGQAVRGVEVLKIT